MVSEAREQLRVAAFPFQMAFFVYSALFGFILYEVGLSSWWWMSLTALLFIMGFFFNRFVLADVPVLLGTFYFIGVTASYLLVSINFPREFFTLAFLIFLFLVGIVGNVLYFLSEKQKISYLNGQISKEGMTLKYVQDWLPLWLVVFGNILLVFAVTPLLWSILYKVSGTKLFWVQQAGPMWGLVERTFEVQTPLSFKDWFGYLLGNVNQSFLGIASLLGIEFSDASIMPTPWGKGVLFIFRVGTISLALGAVKRYLDLRETTQRLIVALGRSAWELELLEARHYGKKASNEEWAILEGRRKMWQLRFRELLHLYPNQIGRVLSFLKGEGLWQLQLKVDKKKRKKGQLSEEGSQRVFDKKALLNHVRAELAEALDEPTLYENVPGLRYEVIKTLFALLKKHPEEPLAPEIRKKVTITLVHLLRTTDPHYLQKAIREFFEALFEAGLPEDDSWDDWEKMLEERAFLAGTYALAHLGDREKMVTLLPALRRADTMLQHDAYEYISLLSQGVSEEVSTLLKTVLRLLEQASGNDHELLPILDELELALKQLSDNRFESYRKFTAFALGILLKEDIIDEGVLARASEVLMATGGKFAIFIAWRLFQTAAFLRPVLLEAFKKSRWERLLIRFLRNRLFGRSKAKQLLAAWLLGRLPLLEGVNPDALLEKVAQDDVSEAVRWMCLRSIAELATPKSLELLQNLAISEKEARLWAVWKYALFACGDAEAIVELLAILERGEEEELIEGIKEILLDARREEGSLILTIFDDAIDKELRVEASEDLVHRRSSLGLLVLGHLLYGTERYPKVLRQCAAEDLGLLARSLHVDDIEALRFKDTPARWAAPPLLHALEYDSDRLVRIRAARALGRLGLADIRQKFEKVLSDPNENASLRQVIARAVGELGDSRWMDFLLSQFAIEKSLQVKQGMVQALDLLGAKTEFFLDCIREESNAKLLEIAIQALYRRPLESREKHQMLEFLKAKAKEVRAATATLLGYQGEEEAVEPLLMLVDHRHEADKKVRRAAISALRSLAQRFSLYEELREPIERVFREDPDHLVVQDTAAVLGELYAESAGPLLLEILKDRQKRDVWKKAFAGIVRTLGNIRWAGAGDYLFELLEKELASEKLHLPRLISLIRPVALSNGLRAKEMLLQLIYLNNQAFSWIAAQSIAELGYPQFIEPLRRFLEEQRRLKQLEPNLEAALLVALVRLGDFHYLPEMVALAHDLERPIVRRRILGLMPDLQVGLTEIALLHAMNPHQTAHEKLRETAVRSLGRLAERLDVTLYSLQWQALSDPRAKIREAAQQAIRSVSSSVYRAIYTLDEPPARPATSPIWLKGEPLHPVFVDFFRQTRTATSSRDIPQLPTPSFASKPNQASEEIAAPSTSSQETASSSPSSSSTDIQPITPPKPYLLELLIEAFKRGDEEVVFKILDKQDEFFAVTNKPEEDFPYWPLWSAFRNFWRKVLTFEETFKDWVLVRGKKGTNVSVEERSFLMMKHPVRAKDYRSFCEKTERMLPKGWHRGAKSISHPDEFIRGISWWDAEAYARYYGWELPTISQFKRFIEGPVVLFDGLPYLWADIGTVTEFTASALSFPRRLVHAINPSSHQISSVARNADDLSFRCVWTLDEERYFIHSLVARNYRLNLIDFLYAVAANEGLEIPFEIAQEFHPYVRRKELLEKVLIAQNFEEEELKTSESLQAEEEIIAAIEEPKVPISWTETFWELIENFRIEKALNFLKNSLHEFPKEYRELLGELETFVEWLHRHSSKVWVAGSWKGTALERPFLVESELVTLGEYIEFCEELDLPLPRSIPARGTVKELDRPVTGLSLYEARRFALAKGCEIPSWELRQRLAEAFDLDEGLLEWTTTSIQPRPQLIKCFVPTSLRHEHSIASSGMSVAAYAAERQTTMGFRCMRAIDSKDVPAFVLSYLPYSTESFALKSLLGD